MKKLLLIGVLALTAACTSPDTATRVLAQAGYTNIQIEGYAFFSCSEDDTFKTAFTATAPNGAQVSGAVCGGWLKGNTIRLD